MRQKPAPMADAREKKTVNADLVKLLRAISNGTNAKATRHDVIFNAAADELELLRKKNAPLPSPDAATIERLREALDALKRLGGMEAFTHTHIISASLTGDELRARITFAAERYAALRSLPHAGAVIAEESGSR